MKILLTHRYFWPDTPPYAAILRMIGDHLSADGHDVRVFASRPSYRTDRGAPAPRFEQLGALTVRRVFAFAEGRRNPVIRVLNVAIYATALVIHILKTRPDIVTASTFPPIAAGWVAGIAARLTGARFIYHMMDLHPEVSALSGGRLGRGWLGRFLTGRDQATLGRASVAVVLSEDMRRTLAARPGGLRCPVEVINNPALISFEDGAPPADLVKRPGAVRIIFAGNLGRFQDLPLLADGIARLFPAHPELELFFLGDGVALPDLRAKWGDNPQVRFGPFLPFAQARPLIQDADAGLVSLAPDIHRVAFPSKMQTYLGLGVPVLALVDPESAIAGTIITERLGAVPTKRTPEAIADALTGLIADPGALLSARRRVAAYREREISPEAVSGRWSALIDQVGRSNTEAR